VDKNDLFALTGRIFIATIFLASAFGKITNFQTTVEYMSAHGLPASVLLCLLAIAVEVLGGLSLVLGYHARSGAVWLLLFMVPTTLVFHISPEQRIQFLKNLAIMGGLLQIAAFGPGEISLDYRSR
jgi:uncharacterized membrane protein YphA (DoxX/SURF4 family)